MTPRDPDDGNKLDKPPAGDSAGWTPVTFTDERGEHKAWARGTTEVRIVPKADTAAPAAPTGKGGK